MNRKLAPPWTPTKAHSFWINHASRLLVRSFETALRPLGLGFAYFPVVMELEASGPLQQKELAERAHVEQPTMAALVARMERDGLLVRTPHPTDRRSSLIALTPKAKRLLPDAREVLTTAAARVTKGFTREEREAFMSLLVRAVANLEQALDA